MKTPTVHEAWGMKVMFLVDLHGKGGELYPTLPDMDDIDLVLLGGDISHYGGRRQVALIINNIRKRCPNILAVAGNCDRPEVDPYLLELEIGLDQTTREVEGVTFSGLSAGLPFGGCPYERTEEDYEKACESLPERDVKPHILITHQPAYETACDLTRGRHVGSKSIRDYIEKAQPELVLSGHIHESIGTDTLGESRLANPGPWAAGRLLTFEIEQGKIGPLKLEHRAI